MRCDSTFASGESKRHSSTSVACSEKSAKFTPLPFNVAPSGDGEPGQILIAVIAPYKPRLKPTAAKSRLPQSSDDRRAAAHDIPEQSGPVVLDHQHDRPLIDAEVIRRDPPTSRAIRHGKRLIERPLESVFRGHPQVHSGKVPHGRDDDFRSKRERGDDDPGSDSAVVWTEWGASSGIVEELAFDAVEYTLRPTGPVGCAADQRA